MHDSLLLASARERKTKKKKAEQLTPHKVETAKLEGIFPGVSSMAHQVIRAAIAVNVRRGTWGKVRIGQVRSEVLNQDGVADAVGELVRNNLAFWVGPRSSINHSDATFQFAPRFFELCPRSA